MLYRYVLMFFSFPFLKPIEPLSVSKMTFWVMPWDIDINLHLTNSRYPMFLNVARTKWLFQLNLVRLILLRNFGLVLSSQTLSFNKEIKPFSKVTVESRVVHWDARFLYMEHRFLVKGVEHGTTLARMAFLKNRSLCSYDKALKARDKARGEEVADYESPEMSEEIASKAELLKLLRENYNANR